MEVKFSKGDTVNVPEDCTATIKNGVVLFEPIKKEPEIDLNKERYHIDYNSGKIIKTFVSYLHSGCSTKKLAEAWGQLSRLSLYAREYFDENEPIRAYIASDKSSNTIPIFKANGLQSDLPLKFNSLEDAKNFKERFKEELNIAKPLL